MGTAAATTTIYLGGSSITWKTYQDKDGSRDALIEWNVLPEHEDDFADLRAAFVAAGQAIPVATPPSWDCVGTPPPGWGVDYGDPGGGCFLVPTPNPCANLRINGHDVCAPPGVSIVIDAGEPLGGVTTLTLEFNGSSITWKTYQDKDGPRDVLIEWSALSEHEDGFADLRAAFLAAGQTIPKGTVAPEGMTP